MKNNQIKLLNELAKKSKSENRNRTKALATLKSAKILTKGGNFTKTYQNLEKVVTNI